MRFVVTGASGFVGAHFVERALLEGHKVTGVYRGSRAANEGLLEHLAGLGCNLVRADILDVGPLQSALEQADCVCHFAAAFKEPGADASYFNRVNVEGTVNLLNAAARANVRRFILCSTAGIYGQRNPGVVNESTPAQPWNEYERSKLAAEEEVRTRARQLRMEYVILRPCAVYGPRDERLAKLFRNAAKGRFPLFGDGNGRRHMVYVSDVAAAFLLAAIRPQAANQEMIIAGPEAVRLRDMLELLAKLLNRKSCGPKLPLRPMLVLAALTEDICKRIGLSPPLYRRRMDFYLNDVAFDCRHARELLGWEPKVDLAEGLARTLDSHVQHQMARVPTYPAVAVAVNECLIQMGSFIT